MSIVEVIASAMAVLAVTAIAWLYSQQRRRSRMSDQHRQWIEDALAIITQEASRKREQLNAIPNMDVTATLAQLNSLVEEQPGQVLSDVEELRRLWTELEHLPKETAEDSTPTAVQPSTLAARAAKLADRIDELAENMLTELV